MDEIKHKENNGRGMFYIQNENGLVAELTYKLKNGVMTIDHTEVKRELENQGIGSSLVDRSVEFAREKGLKIHPLCPFAEVKFDEKPEYRDVLASGT